MGFVHKDNLKRLTGVRDTKAFDPKDIILVRDLFSNDGSITINPVFGEGISLEGGGGSGIYRVTNLVNASPAFAPGGDEAAFELVVITVSGDYDVVLPEDPIVGKRYEIKDGAGDGFISSKNIIPSGLDRIEGIFTSFPLSNNYQSWSLIYAGSNIWRLV